MCGYFLHLSLRKEQNCLWKKFLRRSHQKGQFRSPGALYDRRCQNDVSGRYGISRAYVFVPEQVFVLSRIDDRYHKWKIGVPLQIISPAGLRDKLAEKYLQNGRIIPPAPDKSIIGMTKIKMSKEEDNTDQSGNFSTEGEEYRY